MTNFESWLAGVDREWLWVIQIFFIVLATAIASFFAKRGLARMLGKLGRTRTQWDDIVLIAMSRPLTWMVWLVGLDIAVDVIYIETQSSIFTYSD